MKSIEERAAEMVKGITGSMYFSDDQLIAHTERVAARTIAFAVRLVEERAGERERAFVAPECGAGAGIEKGPDPDVAEALKAIESVRDAAWRFGGESYADRKSLSARLDGIKHTVERMAADLARLRERKPVATVACTGGRRGMDKYGVQIREIVFPDGARQCLPVTGTLSDVRDGEPLTIEIYRDRK